MHEKHQIKSSVYNFFFELYFGLFFLQTGTCTDIFDYRTRILN